MLSVDIRSFSYGEKRILQDIQFKLSAGEHLSILGESGCGKSTLLHIIYGLLHLDEGAIYHGSTKLLGPRHTLIPGEPFMKLVAQEFNIMPFSTVAENLRTHLTGIEEEQDEVRVNSLLQVVEMETYKNTLAKNLSGGQKQRVALAKALANEPKILLLDEPFSNIDSFRKNRLRRLVFNYLKEKDISCITATHDSDEALAFSDKILMLRNGETEMYGSAESVYKSAQTPYQAGFFDEVNYFITAIPSLKIDKGSILFPHQLRLSEHPTDLHVQIFANYFKGTHYLIQSVFEGGPIFFVHDRKLKLKEKVYLEVQTGSKPAID